MEDMIEWNVVNEGQLLDAMVGHKPVGLNKYFQMAVICDKFSESLHKDINPQKIWEHLTTMYNLKVLDENEAIPFPNNEIEFSLPESEFGNLLVKKDEEDGNGGMKTRKQDDNVRITRNVKDSASATSTPRRESKDNRDNNSKSSLNSSRSKDTRKEVEKTTPAKNTKNSRISLNSSKSNDLKTKGQSDDPKPVKRTRARK